MGFINSDSIQFFGLVIGGLTLFVYGIEQLSDGLKSIAGNSIREYIEKYTDTLFMAIIVGTIITAILNSSTAVTVISISLVRAGLMKLEQAIGITIGANVGSVMTSILIGFKIEQFAYYFVAIGIMIMLFTKKKKSRYAGQVLLGFGLLFVGLQIMGDQLITLADEPWFEQMMLIFGQNSWYALLGGTGATAIMNSSAAVIGIVQKLFTTGMIAPAAGIAFIYGANVGTCLTAIIAGAGGSVSSKRAAWFHAIYNIVGALLGMLVIPGFIWMTDWVNTLVNGSPEMWIAQAHLLFNVISTILIMPFVKQSVKLLEWLIPGEDRQGSKIEHIDALDYSLAEAFPAAALEVAKKNTLRMGRNVLERIRLTRHYLASKEEEEHDEIQSVEVLVNKYDDSLSSYLLKIAQQPILAKDQTTAYSKNFMIVKNLERCSDLAMSFANFAKATFEEKSEFSKEAIADMNECFDVVEDMLQKAMYTYETSNADNTLEFLQAQYLVLKKLETDCRDRHFVRMRDNICTDANAIAVYVDMIALLERIGNYATNIANTTVSVIISHESGVPKLAETI